MRGRSQVVSNHSGPRPTGLVARNPVLLSAVATPWEETHSPRLDDGGECAEPVRSGDYF